MSPPGFYKLGTHDVVVPRTIPAGVHFPDTEVIGAYNPKEWGKEPTKIPLYFVCGLAFLPCISCAALCNQGYVPARWLNNFTCYSNRDIE